MQRRVTQSVLTVYFGTDLGLGLLKLDTSMMLLFTGGSEKAMS